MLASVGSTIAAGLAIVALMSPVVTGAALLRTGARKRTAILAGLGVLAGVVIAFFAVVLMGMGECLNDTREKPGSYWWSPRRQICGEETTWVDIVPLGFVLLPSVLIGLGTWLWLRGRRALGSMVCALVVVVPVLPFVYLATLPVYRWDEYPVLYAPLLRPADGSLPARVCFTYGIRSIGVGPDVPGPDQHCAELEQTAEAEALTTDYDQGHTIGELRRLGVEFTRRGLPIEPGPTDLDGLAVARAFPLPLAEAEQGATVVD